jgi:hypothetical protein
MFEVGEEVIVNLPGDQINGLVGTVYDYEPHKLWPVIVEFDYFGMAPFRWPFNEDELEKLDD